MQFMWVLITSMTKSYEISQYAYQQTPTNVVLFFAHDILIVDVNANVIKVCNVCGFH